MFNGAWWAKQKRMTEGGNTVSTKTTQDVWIRRLTVLSSCCLGVAIGVGSALVRRRGWYSVGYVWPTIFVLGVVFAIAVFRLIDRTYGAPKK